MTIKEEVGNWEKGSMIPLCKPSSKKTNKSENTKMKLTNIAIL